MAGVVFSLGSNLGDRAANLEEAFIHLDRIFGKCKGRSSVIETAAQGFCGPDFLNVVAKYSTDMPPRNVLCACKQIERSMGRCDRAEYDRNGARIYRDRIIDIDILFYGDIRISTPELTIPHPQVWTRPFIATLLEQMIP